MQSTYTERKVIYIPPTDSADQTQHRTLTVAAYCRVSSSSEDQLNSYAAQIAHYHHLASMHPEWTFTKVYADEGISGLKTANRPAFQQMMQDCRDGKIQRILTKSISRFSRNTVDCLESLRELTLLGVSVLFEEQHLDTSLCKGEMLVSFLSTLAQKESLSISANLKMGNRMRMKRGTYISSSVPFGYRLVNKQMAIFEPEAAIVRNIFRMYLSGNSTRTIARQLNNKEVASEQLKITKWSFPRVSYILQNETYTGASRWQKRFTTDSLPLRLVKNNGQRDQYFVPNHHPAIISPDEFHQVQKLFAQKKEKFSGTGKTVHPFQGTIRCAYCGTLYQRRCSNGKTYWVCRTHNQNKDDCPEKQVPQQKLEQAFCRMFNKLRSNPQILGGLLNRLEQIHSRKADSLPQFTDLTRQL